MKAVDPFVLKIYILKDKTKMCGNCTFAHKKTLPPIPNSFLTSQSLPPSALTHAAHHSEKLPPSALLLHLFTAASDLKVSLLYLIILEGYLFQIGLL